MKMVNWSKTIFLATLSIVALYDGPAKAADPEDYSAAMAKLNEKPKVPEATTDALNSLKKQVAGLQLQLKTSEAENAVLQKRITDLEARLPKEQPADNSDKTPADSPAADMSAHSRLIGKIGESTITLTAAVIGPIAYISSDKFETSDESYLRLQLKIENQSSTKKVTYKTWNGDAIVADHDFATVKDNFGNILKRMDFGLGSKVDGSVGQPESIYPQDGLSDVLVFEKPVKGTTSLTLELPQGNLEGSGEPLKITLPIK